MTAELRSNGRPLDIHSNHSAAPNILGIYLRFGPGARFRTMLLDANACLQEPWICATVIIVFSPHTCCVKQGCDQLLVKNHEYAFTPRSLSWMERGASR